MLVNLPYFINLEILSYGRKIFVLKKFSLFGKLRCDLKALELKQDEIRY